VYNQPQKRSSTLKVSLAAVLRICKINLFPGVRFMETFFSGINHDLLKHLKQ